jgi:hypothetical protein
VVSRGGLPFNAPGDFEVIEPELAHIRTDEYAFVRAGGAAKLAAAHGLVRFGMRRLRDDLRRRGKPA